MVDRGRHFFQPLLLVGYRAQQRQRLRVGVTFYDGGTYHMNTKSDYIGSVRCVRDI